MTKPTNYRLLMVSLLSTTVLTGCVVWKSDYDALQAQNQQLQSQLTASQQQVSRLLVLLSRKITKPAGSFRLERRECDWLWVEIQTVRGGWDGS